MHVGGRFVFCCSETQALPYPVGRTHQVAASWQRRQTAVAAVATIPRCTSHGLSKYSEHLIGSIGDGKSVLMAPQRSDKAGRPPPLSGDARFSKMYSDPRFARTPKKKAAVEIDARFAGMRRQGVLLSACCDRRQAAPVAVTVYPRSPR